MDKWLVIVSVVIFIFSPILSAAEEDQTQNVLKLSLVDCIVYTFKNNSEIKLY